MSWPKPRLVWPQPKPRTMRDLRVQYDPEHVEMVQALMGVGRELVSHPERRRALVWLTEKPHMFLQDGEWRVLSPNWVSR